MARNVASLVNDGMDVYDAADEKIGTVAEVFDATGPDTAHSGGGYLRVPTGLLGLGKEHHIPFSTIADVRGERIHLRLHKDQLDALGFDAQPTAVDDVAEVDDQSVRRTRSAGPSARITANPAEAADAGPRRRRDDTGRRRLQLREEELIARKQTVETGQVGIRTEVVSEQRTIEVPLTHEEVTIERRAVDRRPAEGIIDDRSRTIEVPVREEQVTLEKRAVVYEEVDVGKRAVQETQQVSGTVRREEAVIEREGDVVVEGDTESTRRL